MKTRRHHRTSLLLGLMFAAGAAMPVLAADDEVESWYAKFQTTYIWQKKPGFDAPYTGPNSLITKSEKSYTLTADVYLGFRPWKDGEVYLNPELIQGVPLSHLSGLGGFSNGEVTRVAGPNPKIYGQHLFLRQTWNLGGGKEAVASDFNQLAGVVDKNRFVLTVGKFSLLDVFDDNAYAKDPRTQFMNAGNMTYTAFDYAADARGYGWGFAGEWYRGDWVVRFGRLTGPREPNGLPIDYQIGRHYGDQVELEHAHEIGGQPGKVRLLLWRNRANLASFRDALNYAAANPEDPDHQYIFKVRNGEKFQYGVGVNVEQAISRNLGVFLRAMNTDGRTETYAFTEADASLATGLSLKGGAWGRAQDTVGLALLRNMLSPDRRDYLAAGGISFFIGDGALHYRPETVFEGYYSLHVAKRVWLTADYQRIENPAYNADRGPVNVGSVRLHAEF